MHRHVRLIFALLLLLGVAGVCASYGGQDTLLTALRAAQAAAALGAILVVAHAMCGAAPERLRRPTLPFRILPLPSVMVARAVVLLC